MIVDFHTHVWETGMHLEKRFVEDARRAWGSDFQIDVTPERHWEAMKRVDKCVVVAFQAGASGAVVPSSYVAAYVRKHPEKLIGFASVDPNDPSSVEQLRSAVRDGGLRGLKLGPVYQNFDPLSRQAEAIYQSAEDLEIPILWHQGATFVENAPLKFGSPVQVDEVANRHPRLTIVIAHLGHPWILETIVTVRKHPRVFADLTALHSRPWQFYNACINSLEYGVMDKLIFGSDFPFFTPEATAEGLRSVNNIVLGTHLPRIPDNAIEDIIYRDSLSLVGLD